MPVAAVGGARSQRSAGDRGWGQQALRDDRLSRGMDAGAARCREGAVEYDVGPWTSESRAFKNHLAGREPNNEGRGGVELYVFHAEAELAESGGAC